MTTNLLINKLKERVDKTLRDIVFFKTGKTIQSDYVEALKYPLIVGGKRTRSIITLLLAESSPFTEDIAVVFDKFAVAIELIHTYSLVHDDLPCMDNDTLRRGKPTSHVIYGEAKALLIGDALLTGAFELISDFDSTYKMSFEEFALLSSFATKVLSQASGITGMVYGQWCDLNSENSTELSWETLEEIHNCKTGKLMAASFQIGVLLLLFSNKIYDVKVIHKFLGLSSCIGEDIGLLFQIIDDILDVTEDSKTLGKTSKKDIESNKLTAVRVLGLEKSQNKAKELFSKSSLRIASFWQELRSLGLTLNDNVERLEEYLKVLLKRKN